MEKITVVCNYCEFSGMEEDLEKVIEFRVNRDSDLESLSLNKFYNTYGDFINVYSYEIINVCPNCLTDSYLTNTLDD